MRGQGSQLLAVLLLLLMVVGGMVFVWPLRTTVAELHAQVDSSTAELAKMETDFVELQALSEEVSGSESAKNSLLDSVPVGPTQDELLLELSDLSSKAGFVLNALNFSKGNDPVLGDYLSVAANFSGDYDKLVAFLQRIENADRLMRVTNLSIQLTSTDSIVFNANIQAFYQ